MPTGDYLYTDGERTYTIDEIFDMVEKELDELKQYKKIEKNLGINFITLVKALKDGVYFKSTHIPEIQFGVIIIIDIENLIVENRTHFLTLQFKDYGKTWSLTKEELEQC